MSALLPPGFEALEPFAGQWAVDGLAARAAVRDASTPEARLAFHAAASPLVPRALAELGALPRAALSDRQQRLLDLVLAYAHVVLAVEIQGSAEPAHARLRAQMRITPT